MARGKKTGGKDFVPGNVHGKGRPKVPDDVKEARKLNQVEFERVANKYLYLTRDELKEAAEDPDTTVIELLVSSIIVKAVEKGDQMRLEFLLNRLIGRVVDRIEVKPVEPFVLHRRDGSEPVVMGVKAQEGEA